MLKIFKPCDFHVHLREGQLLKYVLKENNKNFQKILVMPNLIKPITNKNILSKYRSFVLNNNNNTEILFTIYLNQDCSIIDLKNMVYEKLFSSVGPRGGRSYRATSQAPPLCNYIYYIYI